MTATPNRPPRTDLPGIIGIAQEAPKRRYVPVAMLDIFSLALLTAGCTGLQTSPVQTPNTHVLIAKPVAKELGPKRNLVLDVGAVRAWPGFDTAQMVYVMRPYELDYFASAQWADTPARMLGPLLAQALEQGGSFRAVLQAAGSVPADLRLNTELIRLQQNFDTRPSHVQLVLRVQVVDIGAKRILTSRLFEANETAPTDDAYGGVIAANVALQGVLQQLVSFLAGEFGAQ